MSQKPDKHCAKLTGELTIKQLQGGEFYTKNRGVKWDMIYI